MGIDNPLLNIQSDDFSIVESVYDIAVAVTGKKPLYYCIDQNFGLVCFWYCESNMTDSLGNKFSSNPEGNKDYFANIHLERFPFDPKVFVCQWLKEAKPDDFAQSQWSKRYKSDDVWSTRAFRFYTEDWGHVGHSNRACFAVKPTHGWQGK